VNTRPSSTTPAAAALAAGPSGSAALSDYDVAVEAVIEAWRQALLVADTDESRRLASREFYRAMSLRRRPVVDRMERQRLRSVGL